jgi:hypothetical protein
MNVTLKPLATEKGRIEKDVHLRGTSFKDWVGLGFVGPGDSLRGRRESVQKLMFSKPFHPTRFCFGFLLPSVILPIAL